MILSGLNSPLINVNIYIQHGHLTTVHSWLASPSPFSVLLVMMLKSARAVEQEPPRRHGYPRALVLHAILDMSDDSCLSTTAIYYNVVAVIVRSSQLSSSLLELNFRTPFQDSILSPPQLSRAIRWPTPSTSLFCGVSSNSNFLAPLSSQ